MKLHKHTVFPAALLAALLTWNAAPAAAQECGPEPQIEPIRLTWTPPTTRVDGTAMPLSEIAGYRLYVAIDGDQVPVDKDAPHEALGPGTSRTHQLSLPYRPDAYTITAALRTVSIYGGVSDLSNSDSTTRTVHPACPGAPVLTIIITGE